MKSNLLMSVLLLASGFIAPLAIAADGTITLTGEITGTTCTISGGTGGVAGSGANFPVVLDKVQASALASDGATASSKPFFIYVGGGASCADATKVAVLYESTSPAINPATGNLRNTAPKTAAAKVEVQIIDGATLKPLDLRTGHASTTATVTAGLATLPFAARYVATGGAAGVGLVSTAVQYSVVFP
ncbi:fimbrial protein [Pseudomonas gessardii]|uniref:fimbrial protein n=1 Tax=Pseudomonas gessardii TaxID=78544 RepID=UPI001473BDAE|nr:fimbrial protein [Pseudomonas gessardii]NNA91992.1 type 1 fimbrial protein [Pseudomonas gessardii]